MKVVFMENEYLRIGVLPGRGSDIFEFFYKPEGLDFMLRLDKDILNPSKEFSQIRSTPNQLEDYYYGGWQEAIPNSPSFNYRGAELGQHGEVMLIPWKHAITENSRKKVSMKLWVRPVRLPLLLEKTLTLQSGSAELIIEERLTNDSRTDLDIMWGHHIAFGLPFLKNGGHVETNASNFFAEPAMPDKRKFRPGIEGAWPEVENFDGEMVDASKIPAENEKPYSDLAYLSGFPEQAAYTLWEQSRSLGFTVKWEAKVFSHLWFWQERYGMQDAPWWGKAYAIGLEPWTSRWTETPEKSIEKGEWLKIEAGESLSTSLSAGIISK
jgi:galactose mutarotase-like enzyme